jgi:hypothetical protein
MSLIRELWVCDFVVAAAWRLLGWLAAWLVSSLHRADEDPARRRVSSRPYTLLVDLSLSLDDASALIDDPGDPYPSLACLIPVPYRFS